MCSQLIWPQGNKQTEDGMTLSYLVAGRKKEDINVKVIKESDEYVLEVKAGGSADVEYMSGEWTNCLYTLPYFTDSLAEDKKYLGSGDIFDTENITSKIENGILYVNIPFSEKAKPKVIEIEVK